MIHLNIIPENKKKEVKLKFIYDHLKIFFEFIFLLFIIFTIYFLLLKLALDNHFIVTIENTTMLTKNSENYSKKVSEINTKVLNIISVQENFVYWSRLIKKIESNQLVY